MPPASQPRVVVVTGASRGIGRAIAVALGALGSNVVINYHANRAAADDAAQEVEARGGVAMTVQGDVGTAAGRSAIVDDAVARFGAVDLLVNNAGVAPKVRAD